MKKQDWNERITKELRDNYKKELKRQAQALYYKAREQGIKHPEALAITIELIVSDDILLAR